MNLQRSNSISTTSLTSRKLLVPSNTHFIMSSSTALAPPRHHRRLQKDDKLLIPKHNASSSSPVGFDELVSKPNKQTTKISSLLRSFLNLISFPAAAIINLPASSCKWLTISSHLSVTPSLGRKVTGTLFGNRRGHVSFAVQLDPRSEPVLLLELAMSTSSLVKEMSSGLVRIALESERQQQAAASGRNRKPLFHEPTWTMYCNGRKLGYAASRTSGESDVWQVLNTIRSVSVGAGVIPVMEDGKTGNGEGELLYMRARFERVVGSRDSEAFYMLNPDGSNGGPELSIFLLRI